jgi:hypothetical protein
VYKKEKYTKTSLDGEVEIVEKESRSSSGLLEFCVAILTITLSILTATLILNQVNHASSNRGLDQSVPQPEK